MINPQVIVEMLQEAQVASLSNITKARTLQPTYPSGVGQTDQQSSCFAYVGLAKAMNPTGQWESASKSCQDISSEVNFSYSIILQCPEAHFSDFWKKVFQAVNGKVPISSPESIGFTYLEGTLLSLQSGIYTWLDEWKFELPEII